MGGSPASMFPLLGVEEAAAQGIPKLHVGIGAQGKAAFGDVHRRLNDFLGDAVVVQHARLKAAQMEAERLAAIVLLQQLLPCEDGTVLQVHADEAERVFDVRAEKVGGDKAVAQQHVPADPEAEYRQQHQIEHQPERNLGIEAVRPCFSGPCVALLDKHVPEPADRFQVGGAPGIVPELLAQGRDVHVHAAVELVPFLFGEQVEQILAGEDPARPPRQMVQELDSMLVRVQRARCSA